MTLSLTALSVVDLIVTISKLHQTQESSVITEVTFCYCYVVECRYPERHCAECHYAECRYLECRCAVLSRIRVRNEYDWMALHFSTVYINSIDI